MDFRSEKESILGEKSNDFNKKKAKAKGNGYLCTNRFSFFIDSIKRTKKCEMLLLVVHCMVSHRIDHHVMPPAGKMKVQIRLNYLHYMINCTSSESDYRT